MTCHHLPKLSSTCGAIFGCTRKPVSTNDWFAWSLVSVPNSGAHHLTMSHPGWGTFLSCSYASLSGYQLQEGSPIKPFFFRLWLSVPQGAIVLAIGFVSGCRPCPSAGSAASSSNRAIIMNSSSPASPEATGVSPSSSHRPSSTCPRGHAKISSLASTTIKHSHHDNPPSCRLLLCQSYLQYAFIRRSLTFALYRTGNQVRQFPLITPAISN